MTRLLKICVLAVALMLPATVASAQDIKLFANLNGGEETPILNTGAVGTAEVSVGRDLELTVTLRVFNIPATTTAGHIHIGPRGIAGPVVLNFPPSIVGRTGDFTMVFRLNTGSLVPRPAIGINTIEDAIQAITGGNSYVNVHTTQFPGGEIRGQLQVVP